MEKNCPTLSSHEEAMAPWNDKEPEEKEIEVTVSMTLSKTMKIKVSDYRVLSRGKDEDGEYFEEVDYSDCDLKGAVEQQILTPDKAYDKLFNAVVMSEDFTARGRLDDLKGWDVDDFEVIPE